jgi:hypothetical protein
VFISALQGEGRIAERDPGGAGSGEDHETLNRMVELAASAFEGELFGRTARGAFNRLATIIVFYPRMNFAPMP